MHKKFNYCLILFMAFLINVSLMFFSFMHPYFVSNTDINYNSKEKTIEIVCRIFTDNLEKALEKANNKKLNVLNPVSKLDLEKMMFNYINEHLKIKVNDKTKELIFLGYEKNEDAIWIYIESSEETSPKNLTIENSILYEMHPEQINMVHFSMNGEKKCSRKVNNPESKIVIVN